MRFIVCDDCGGYYKLEPGESLEDFAECQCGGHLRYAQSLEEIIKSRNAPTKTCIHCGARNRETNTVCFTCGKKLGRVNRRISDHPAGRYLKTRVNRRYPKTHVNILDRISFRAVIAGLIFLFVASIIASFGFAGSILSTNGIDVVRSLGGYIVVLIFAIIASGFIASYVSGSVEYLDGLLNGGMVGFIHSVFVAFLFMIFAMMIDVAAGILAGLITLVAYALVYGSLTALGGLIGVWLRNFMESN
ncbi:MAG: hypothetical protein ABFC12_06425 [Methanobacterium sp.]